MPNYRWTCLVCNSGNNPENYICSSCGCPAEANGSIIEGWKKSNSQPAQKPSMDINKFAIWGNWALLSQQTTNCPSCKLHMYITDKQCPHCGIELNFDQRNSLISNYRKTQQHGRDLAVIFFPLFFITVIFLSYVFNYF